MNPKSQHPVRRSFGILACHCLSYSLFQPGPWTRSASLSGSTFYPFLASAKWSKTLLFLAFNAMHNQYGPTNYPIFAPSGAISKRHQSYLRTSYEWPDGKKAFHYTPLESQDNVRLLKVSPDLCDGMISMTLTQLCLGTESYNCLSYVWGEERRKCHAVLINGEVFGVRQNLHDFLQRSRTLCPGKYLWIDAISIDQRNTSERNAQVERMGDIYAKAEKVFVWLGTSSAIDSVVSLALESAALRQSPTMTPPHASPGPLTHSFDASCRYPLCPDPLERNAAADRLRMLIGELVRGDTEGFKKMFYAVVHCEYTSRVWVYQEVAWARNPCLVTSSSGLTLHAFLSAFASVIDAPYDDHLAFAHNVADAAGRLLRGCRLGSMYDRRRNAESGITT
jgi:hypothetical protein